MICPPVNSEKYKALISKLGPLGAFKVFISLRKEFKELSDAQFSGKLDSFLQETLEQDPEPLTDLASLRAEVNKQYYLENKLAIIAKYNSENEQKVKLVDITEQVGNLNKEIGPVYDVEYEVPLKKLPQQEALLSLTQQETPITFESADLEKLNNINYVFKSTQKILENLPKIKKWESDKSISKETLWKKIGDLGFSKEQLALIKESEGITVEEKLSSFLANYSYTVEINTAKKNHTDDGIDSTEHIELNVPGGTNYKINVFKTPLITPSIINHFFHKNQIGWFRSDDKINNAQLIREENKEKKKHLIQLWGDSPKYKELLSHNIKVFNSQETGDSNYGGGILVDLDTNKYYYLHPDDAEPLLNTETSSDKRDYYDKQIGGELTKTRRILEVQSDLFQKGRERIDLTSYDLKVGDTFETDKGLIKVTDILEGSQTINIKNLTTGVSQYLDRDTFITAYKNKIGKSPVSKNEFLQLLNKDNNWVTFFIKSIIQDSAKKGYEKVLFPTGNTASKVEGHTTLEEFKKYKADRLRKLEKENVNLSSTPEYTIVESETSLGTVYKVKNNSTGQFEFVQYRELTGAEEFIKDKEYDKILLNKNNVEISQIKKELEKIETEGFGALRPIYNFYENILSRVLAKKGFNPKLITDEHGNTWNEVEIKKEQAEEALVFESALDMFTSINPTPVESDVLDDFWADYRLRNASKDEFKGVDTDEQTLKQLNLLKEEYKKLYNLGNIEYASKLRNLKKYLADVDTKRVRLPKSTKMVIDPRHFGAIRQEGIDLSLDVITEAMNKIKADADKLEKYRIDDTSLTASELKDIDNLVEKYKSYLSEFSELETLGDLFEKNYQEVLKIKGIVEANNLYRPILSTFQEFKNYNELVNTVILLHTLNQEKKKAKSGAVSSGLDQAKEMVKKFTFDFDINKMSGFFMSLTESTNPLLQLVSKMITKMKTSRQATFNAFTKEHKEKLEAFNKATQGMENPTSMFVQKDSDGKYTKFLVDKISFSFKSKISNLFEKVNYKNPTIAIYQVAEYVKLISKHLTVQEKSFYAATEAQMLNELALNVITQSEYDLWYSKNSPKALEEAMQIIKDAYIADPNLDPDLFLTDPVLGDAARVIIGFEGDMFYSFDMDVTDPENKEFINPQYLEIMGKDQAIIDYYNYIIDTTKRLRLLMPPNFENDLFESTSIFEISKSLTEQIKEDGFLGASALGIEEWAISTIAENSNFQEMDVNPATGKVKFEPRRGDFSAIDVDEMSLDLTKVLNAHAATAITYANALATAKEVNIVKHVLESSVASKDGSKVLEHAIKQLEEVALSELAGKEKKQELITNTKVLSTRDRKKIEEYSKKLAEVEQKGKELDSIDVYISAPSISTTNPSYVDVFRRNLEAAVRAADRAGFDLDYYTLRVTIPSTLATNIKLRDLLTASDADLNALLNNATSFGRITKVLEHIKKERLPTAIKNNLQLQERLVNKIKNRGSFISGDSMFSSFMSWTRKVGLSFRFSTVLADLVMNMSGAMKEAAAGIYFDYKTLTHAYGIAMMETVASEVKERGKLIQFRDSLGLNETIRKPNEKFNEGLEKYKDKEYALYLNKLAGDISENAVMIAILKNKKITVIDNNGNTVETNLWDAFDSNFNWLYPSSPNPLAFDLKADNSAYIDLVSELSGTVKQAVYKITGMTKDSVAYTRDTYARLAMMFKSWLPQAVYSRIGGEKLNLVTGNLERGMYRTLLDRNGLLRDEEGKFDSKRFYTNMLYFVSAGYFKGNLRQHDLANLRRLRVEATVILLLLGAFYALQGLSGGGGDDEDKEMSQINRSLLNLINKLYKDSSAFYDSESLLSTFGTYQVAPILMLGKIGEALGHIGYTVTGFKGMDGKYKPLYSTGELKGTSKAWRKLLNVIPILSGIQGNIESAKMDKTTKRAF